MRYDSMTSQLLIHGGTLSQRKEIVDRLEARIESLRRPSRKVLVPLALPTNSKLEIIPFAADPDYQELNAGNENRCSFGEAHCEYEVTSTGYQKICPIPLYAPGSLPRGSQMSFETYYVTKSREFCCCRASCCPWRYQINTPDGKRRAVCASCFKFIRTSHDI